MEEWQRGTKIPEAPIDLAPAESRLQAKLVAPPSSEAAQAWGRRSVFVVCPPGPSARGTLPSKAGDLGRIPGARALFRPCLCKGRHPQFHRRRSAPLVFRAKPRCATRKQPARAVIFIHVERRNRTGHME